MTFGRMVLSLTQRNLQIGTANKGAQVADLETGGPSRPRQRRLLNLRLRQPTTCGDKKGARRKTETSTSSNQGNTELLRGAASTGAARLGQGQRNLDLWAVRQLTGAGAFLPKTSLWLHTTGAIAQSASAQKSGVSEVQNRFWDCHSDWAEAPCQKLRNTVRVSEPKCFLKLATCSLEQLSGPLNLIEYLRC